MTQYSWARWLGVICFANSELVPADVVVDNEDIADPLANSEGVVDCVSLGEPDSSGAGDKYGLTALKDTEGDADVKGGMDGIGEAETGLGEG
jgi:hypothetical protein